LSTEQPLYVLAGVVATVMLVACGASTTSSSGGPAATALPVRPTATAVGVPYVPPAAAGTAGARFSLTPHPSPTATTVPTATPAGARVTFAAVQQILTGNCAGCHPPNQGLDLTTGHAYASVVDVPSREAPSLMRVKPGDPANSYLFQKVTQAKPLVGARMPREGPPLTSDEITTLRSWIEQGAPA